MEVAPEISHACYNNPCEPSLNFILCLKPIWSFYGENTAFFRPHLMTVVAHILTIQWSLPLKFVMRVIIAHVTLPPNLYCLWSSFGVFRGEKLYFFSTYLHQQLRMKLATVPVCARVCPPNLASLVSTCRRFVPGHLDFFPVRLSAPRVIVSYFSATCRVFPP